MNQRSHTVSLPFTLCGTIDLMLHYMNLLLTLVSIVSRKLLWFELCLICRTMCSVCDRSGLKRLCLWLHLRSPPPPPAPPRLPAPPRSSASAWRRRLLLVVVLLCSLLLMLLLLLWNYHCLFISHMCSPPEEGEEEGAHW